MSPPDTAPARPLPELPVTWGLRRAAVVPVAAAVVLTVSGVVVALALPAVTRAAFGPAQLGTLLVLLLLALSVLLGLAASRVTASAEELVVRNVFRVRRVRWAAVRGLRYRPDDPWPVLLLGDGEQFGLIGMQRADGPRSRHNAAELAAVILALTG